MPETIPIKCFIGFTKWNLSFCFQLFPVNKQPKRKETHTRVRKQIAFKKNIFIVDFQLNRAFIFIGSSHLFSACLFVYCMMWSIKRKRNRFLNYFNWVNKMQFVNMNQHIYDGIFFFAFCNGEKQTTRHCDLGAIIYNSISFQNFAWKSQFHPIWNVCMLFAHLLDALRCVFFCTE